MLLDSVSISVFMTVKNGESFIRQSIGSVLGQSYLPFEIVVIDDGSSDSTCQIIEDIVKETGFNIRLIKTKGVGRAKALSLAVDNCLADWCANIDADDYWLSNKLKRQVELMAKEPEAKIITTKSYIVIENDEVESVDNDFFCNNNDFYQRLSKKDFYFGNKINHSSIVFSKNLYYIVGGYNKELSKQIDYDLWIRFLLNNEYVYQVSEQLTVKRLHARQSFENKKIFIYRFNDFILKLKSLKYFSAPKYYYIIAVFYFPLGFLPRGLKEFLKKYSLFKA